MRSGLRLGAAAVLLDIRLQAHDAGFLSAYSEMMMMSISLDLHATTPTAPEVVEAMAPYWRELPWNAHSSHAGGASAERAVERARGEIADLIGASPAELTAAKNSAASA